MVAARKLWIARASVRRCAPLSPWIRIGKSKVQDVWPAPSDSGRNLRGTGKGKGTGGKQKSAFFPFFVLSIPTFRGICHREETQRKTGSVSGKTIERTLNVICVFLIRKENGPVTVAVESSVRVGRRKTFRKRAVLQSWRREARRHVQI